MDIDTFLGRLHRLPANHPVILTFKPEASSAGVKLFTEDVIGPAIITEADLTKLESVFQSQSWEPLPNRQVVVTHLPQVDLQELASLAEHIEKVTPADDLFQRLLAESTDALKVIFMRHTKSILFSLREPALQQKIEITCTYGFENENPDYPIAEITFIPPTTAGQVVQFCFHGWGSLIRIKGQKDAFAIKNLTELKEFFWDLLESTSQPTT